MVIDLSRLPSQGRDVAINIRTHKTTRAIPIIFTDGDPEKVNNIQQILPDAIYCSRDEIEAALHKAINDPPEAKPLDNVFAGYSGTPLLKKLTIKADSDLCLINAPGGLLKKMGTLPQGVTIRTILDGPCDLILWFVESAAVLDSMISRVSQVCKEQKAGYGSAGRKNPPDPGQMLPSQSSGRLVCITGWWIIKSALLIPPGPAFCLPGEVAETDDNHPNDGRRTFPFPL